MAGTITGPITFTTAGQRVPVYLQDPLRWPLASSWDALAAGTHRSRPDASGDAVPPYVPRDQDLPIRTRLTRAANEGGLVLVVGDSTAGKTRACFEALRAQLPEHRVVAPAGGPDLLTAVEVIDPPRHGASCGWTTWSPASAPTGWNPRCSPKLSACVSPCWPPCATSSSTSSPPRKPRPTQEQSTPGPRLREHVCYGNSTPWNCPWRRLWPRVKEAKKAPRCQGTGPARRGAVTVRATGWLQKNHSWGDHV